MRNPFEEARKVGYLWIAGEMQIPYPSTFRDAYREACRIAEACGYLVGTNGSSFDIHGGDLCGYVTLDWIGSPGSAGPQKFSHWTCESVYANEACAV